MQANVYFCCIAGRVQCPSDDYALLHFLSCLYDAGGGDVGEGRSGCGRMMGRMVSNVGGNDCGGNS